ncbi:MAG: MBL fold metallo-hydrolase [Deltaproteobacteria bacterium]|nr:MBL fold metallo-hydrolase [Deltaproteobacteria bacterium]
MPLRVGRFTLHEIRDCSFATDGGTLFGPVPRREWGKAYPPDEENRIALMSRCLLVDSGERKILVDTGLGDKMSLEEQRSWQVDRSQFDLDRELVRAGTSREAITDVVLTHLHCEHSGGTTRRRPDGGTELAFPNATFHLQRRQFRWAHHPTERDASSFRLEDFAKLEQSGRLHLCEGETELFEGIEVCVTEGHTVGQQLLHIGGEGVEVLCAGDLLPTAGHLKLAAQMASDLYPLTGLEEKKMLLAEAVETGTIVFLPHETRFAACRLRENEGGVEAGEIVSF